MPTQSAETHTGFRVWHIALTIAGLLVLLGLLGQSHAAIGYALFLVASLLIFSALALFAIFALTQWFETEGLRRAYATAFWMGGWTYVLAVSALAGYFVFEALAGRISLRYIIFGPAILAAIIILDVGIWRVIVKKNMPTIRRFGDLWQRPNLDQDAMRKTMMDEVILHRSLFSVSPFRWARHQLIFWGFGLMFMVELAAVMFREVFPSFGWTDLWHNPVHPLRLGFDIAYDLTGLMVLIGCVMALAFRMAVQGKEAQKFTDTPTAIFLFVVTLSGFVLEGSRLAIIGTDAPGAWASFVGRLFAPISPAGAVAEEFLWIGHALLACAFIAYVPAKRLIHSCATPVGRMLYSQKSLLAAKKKRVIEGLARRFGHR